MSVLPKVSLLCSVALTAAAEAATSGTWTGAKDGFWTNVNNWAEGVVPGRYYAPDGTLTGERNSIANFGAVPAGAATVIDFDGVRAISNLVVSGASAPAYTFGTSADQAVPLDDRGKFWIKSDAAHVPTMGGYLVLGRDNEDTAAGGGPANGALYSYVVNDAAEELVLNGFGFLDMGNAYHFVPCFQGSGDIRLCGPYHKGPSGTSSNPMIPDFVKSGGQLTIDLDLTCYSLSCHPSAASRIDVTAGHTLTLTSTKPITFYQANTTVGGEGTIVLTGGDVDEDLKIIFYQGIRGQIDTKVTAPNMTAAHALEINGYGTFAFTNPQNEIAGEMKFTQTSAQYQMIVEAPALGSKGQSGPYGSGSSLLMQHAYLKYTGTGETMNRDITSVMASVVSGYTTELMEFNQSGTGVWRVESQIVKSGGYLVLNLRGGSSSSGVWAGVLGSETSELSKLDSGTWRLDAANTYTGKTTVYGGLLELGSAGSIAESSELVLSYGNLKVDAAEEGARTVTLKKVTVKANATITVEPNVTLEIAATNRTSGTLNIVRPLSSTVKVTCLDAGDAPSWLTVNGSAVTVMADGTLVRKGVAEWKNPVDGTWGDATKWTQSPSETMPAEIAVSGGSYTVRVAADVATTNVTVGAGVTGETNTLEVAKRMDASTGVFKLLAGSVLKVVEGGEFYYNNACRHPSEADKNYQGVDISVANGARLEVAGGLTMLTNVTGYADVGGTAGGKPAEVLVSGGEFFYQPRTMTSGNYNCKGPLRIKAGGRLVVTNEAEITMRTGINGDSPVLMYGGGETILAGSSKMTFRDGPAPEGATKLLVPNYRTGTGSLIIDEDASFKCVSSGGSSFYCEPCSDVANPVARLIVRGRSVFSPGLHTFWVRGSVAKGRAYATFENEQSHRINYLSTIGYKIGYGELNVKSGEVTLGQRGIVVGVATYDNTHGVTGVVNVTSGHLYVDSSGSCNSGWGGNTHLMGVIVGSSGLRNGDNKSTLRTGARAGFGFLNLTGGTLTNDYGNIVVGYGPVADGTLLVDGSETLLNSSPIVNKHLDFINTNSFVAVGAAGGLGRMILSNGTVTVQNRVYVGGIVTNDFVNNLKMGWALYDYSTGGFDKQIGTATGTLAVAGGSFTARHPIIVGSDGSGTVEIGPSGVLTAPTLVLSNQTASVLSYRFGAEGIGQATVGNLVIAPGAELTVDVTDYTGRNGNFRLLKADSVEGTFAKVTVTDRKGRPEIQRATLTVDGKGIRYHIPRGVVLILR